MRHVSNRFRDHREEWVISLVFGHIYRMIITLSDPLKDTRKAYEEIAEVYNQENQSCDEIVNDLTTFLGGINGKIIIDVGSGHGRDTKYFSGKGFTSIGLDLSVELTRIARKVSWSSSFLLADMRHLPFRDKAANGLWVCASFHHLPRNCAPSTLSEFYRVLTSAGVIHLSVKKGDFVGFEDNNRYQGKPRYYSFYEEEQVTTMLSESGFCIFSQTESLQELYERKWINIVAKKHE